MASLTPLSESVPSAAVEPLTLAMAPKLIGLPAPMTTHPNLSALHLSVPPLLEVFALPPQAAATMTRTAPRASPVRILRFFMFPPPWGGPQPLNRNTGEPCLGLQGMPPCRVGISYHISPRNTRSGRLTRHQGRVPLLPLYGLSGAAGLAPDGSGQPKHPVCTAPRGRLIVPDRNQWGPAAGRSCPT